MNSTPAAIPVRCVQFLDIPQIKQTLMKEFDKLSKLNKALVSLTIVFLIYGYLCRIVGLYFFWESKTIGWTLLFVTIISILIQRIKTKRLVNKKTLSEKIFIGITVFILLVKSIIFIVIPQTDAYKSAKQFLMTDITIADEVGEVHDIFLVPVGGMAMSSSSAGQTGQADLNFIIKGKNKFKDINLQLTKELETNWTIIETK